MTIKIQVNGEARDVEEGTTVSGLLVALGLTDGPVAVERNGEVVRRKHHPETAIHEGDTIEIVHFVGGG